MPTTPSESAQNLRQRAEELFRVSEALIPELASPEETKRLFHELRVHQIQLEMQNEELRCAHEELCASQSRYFDLYDLAPVGYLTIDDSGRIKEANLAAATMLGVARSVLIKKTLNRLIFKDDQDIYYLRQQQSHDSSPTLPDMYEIRLVRADGSQFWVHLQLTAMQNGESWITFTDITERKLAEEACEAQRIFAHYTLDGLTANICVIDAQGMIVNTNNSWNTFAIENNAAEGTWGTGVNYLEVCRAVSGKEAVDVEISIAGINAVLDGTVPGFIMEYPCHSPDTKRWFVVRASRFSVAGAVYAVISHENITSIKKAEINLEAANTMLQTVIDTAPVRIFWKDTELRFLGCNRAFAADLGIGCPEDLIGKDNFQVMRKEQAEICRTTDRMIMSSGPPLLAYEQQQTIRDGDEIKWLRVSKVPLRNKEDAIIGVLGVYEDITENKRVINSLSESEERYRLLAETMLQGVILQNAAGIITYVNPAAERILGRSRKELLGGNSVSIEHLTIRENGQIFPGLEHPAMVAFQTGSPVQNVLMGIFDTKKDSYCWLNVTSVPVFSQDNNHPLGVYTIFEDITMRKRTEEELANSEVRYRQLFEMEADSIIMADRESNCIIEVNPAASKLFGYTREEFFQLKVTDLSVTPEQTRANVHNGITRIPHRRARKKDGSEFPAELTVCYFTYHCRTVHVATIRDITERTLSEKQLVDLNLRLSEMNEHQIKVQERERLAISRNIHDDLGQSISLLKLDMGMIQFKKCSDCTILDGTIRAMCENLDQIAVKVQQIAFDLRPPLLDNMGLHAAIEWQVNEIKKRCVIDFILILNEEIEPLDESTTTVVMRIFQEGLTNIIRHSKATEVCISLCKKGSNLILEISDNGCGITPEQLASSKAYGLMGMQERAKSCRGELTLTGDPGNGTILNLMLPLHQGV